MEHDDIYPDGDEGFSKMMAYHDLLNELRSMIESGRLKNAPVGHRTDRLKCQACGAREEGLASFIIIDLSMEIIQRGSGRCYLTAYDFICPACGLRQTAIFKR